MAHEVGHVVSRALDTERKLEALTPTERERVAMEMEKVFRTSRDAQGFRDDDAWARNPQEWFAEVLKVYLLEPEAAKQQAPLTCGILRKFWNEHPILGQVVGLS